MEEVVLSTALVVLGALGLQDPPLGQEIHMARELQTVLDPPSIPESLWFQGSQGNPEGLGSQEFLFLLFPQHQVLPWVLAVLEAQSIQAGLSHPCLLYRDRSQVAVAVRSVPENLACQLHPGLPSAPLLPRQDCPSFLDSQDRPKVPVTPALLGVPLGLPGLSHPLVPVCRAVLGPLCHPASL